MPDYFSEKQAAQYDDAVGSRFDPLLVDPAVDFLAGLADGGAVLEFGIGTGRVALPLAERGIRVHGIDLSTAMVERLRAKPGAEKIATTIGDFATTKVEGTFSLVYLVFNTIMNLTTMDDQIACFHNARVHLKPGGHFVIEVVVPDLQRLSPGETLRPLYLTDTGVGFDEYDVVWQRLVSHHYATVDGELEDHAIPFRYAWPSELDLMARLAGMTLRERWGNWKREPFTRHSTEHISVWGKATR
ncbi:MAG TPA: class I SAM-dependent methyltransferase [Solirubrobacteraceae bacterium]|jgi:SAM-dependent methyltransferase